MDKSHFETNKELGKFEQFVINRISIIDKAVTELTWIYEKLDEEVKELKEVLDETLDLIKRKVKQ